MQAELIWKEFFTTGRIDAYLDYKKIFNEREERQEEKIWRKSPQEEL